MRIIFKSDMIYWPWQKAGRTRPEQSSFFQIQIMLSAVIAVSDKIKDSSVQAIRQLHSMGIEVHMLTGDNEQTAAKIAAEAGIDSYKAEVLATGKT